MPFVKFIPECLYFYAIVHGILEFYFQVAASIQNYSWVLFDDLVPVSLLNFLFVLEKFVYITVFYIIMQVKVVFILSIFAFYFPALLHWLQLPIGMLSCNGDSRKLFSGPCLRAKMSNSSPLSKMPAVGFS